MSVLRVAKLLEKILHYSFQLINLKDDVKGVYCDALFIRICMTDSERGGTIAL
jgi:hypothetical protein